MSKENPFENLIITIRYYTQHMGVTVDSCKNWSFRSKGNAFLLTRPINKIFQTVSDSISPYKIIHYPIYVSNDHHLPDIIHITAETFTYLLHCFSRALASSTTILCHVLYRTDLFANSPVILVCLSKSG